VGRTVFDLAPLLKMSSHNLFRLGPCTCLFDTPNVERAVLSRESADATHVISIIRKLVAREAVLARIGQRAFRIREGVQVFTLPAIRAAPASKEETTVTYARQVCARRAGIFLDVAARLRFCLAAVDNLAHTTPVQKPTLAQYVLGVVILPVTSGPLVVPYI